MLSYAAPAFYAMLSDHDKSRIERIQRTCTIVIFPDLEYEQRLEKLDIPLLCDFLHDLGAGHFCRIASDPSQPLLIEYILIRVECLFAVKLPLIGQRE